MKIRLSSHGAYRTEYHVVFVTKYRRCILNPGLATYLGTILPKAIKPYPGVEIVEYNIQPDHVHIVMVIPPKYACSDILGRTKQVTASLLRKKFEWLNDVYKGEKVVWSPGCFISTVGVNEHQILNYVRWQRSQDLGQMKFEI